jgi:hypothetical protein
MLDKYFPKDKRAHALAGLGGGAFLGWYLPAIWAVTLVVVIAVGWEYLNKAIDPSKEIDIMDIAWGVAGAVVGMILVRL